ncbi:MAG: AmmeMemoRadiSam system radical SAM enzyme [Candidatus Bathyarchaeota archaeon]|nr:AmmeMemoRadiSam system radical SAM enzyme [Candidatus Bathyarchaeota archaeon]
MSVRESMFYGTLPDGSVRCGVCERRCRIPEGGRGFCGSRRNIEGRLYTVAYGDLSSISLNPIEKKPMFHYWPGSRALSAGSWGCNLRCVYCQNHEISMAKAEPGGARYLSPEGFVGLALDRGSQGLSFTFNETSCTLLEYVIDCLRLARPRGLYRNLNTNGYMTPEALEVLMAAGLDSICVDIKGDRTFYRRLCNGADVEVVWRNASEAKRRGLHVEMVNLVIPGANDGEGCLDEIITRMRDELGRDTSLHFTRFYPAHRSHEHGLTRVTPVEALERARAKALEEGLDYVYVGNVPGHEGENTFCPRCGRLLIRRHGFGVLGYSVTVDSKCPECGRSILVVGKPVLSKAY